MRSIRTRTSRGAQGVLARVVGVGGRAWRMASRPAAEVLEPRSLMAAPVLSATGMSLNEKFRKSFTAQVASFSIADPTATAKSFHATILWGDGSSSTGTVKALKKGGGKFVVKGTHVYGDGVTDQDATINLSDLTTGATATASTIVNVSGAPITLVSIGPPPLIEGEQSAYDLAIIKTSAKGSFTATIVYPDGTTQVEQFQDIGGGTQDLNGDHTFAESSPPGQPYMVQIKVVGAFMVGGKHGKASFPVSFQIETPITVQDAPLLPSVDQKFQAEAGVPFSAAFDFLDKNSLATVGDYTATVDWGDNELSLPEPLTDFEILGKNDNVDVDVVVSGHHIYDAPAITRSKSLSTTRTGSRWC